MQISIEARIVHMSNSDLRDSGFDIGWGIGVEGVMHNGREGQPKLTFGLGYDHMTCEEDFLKIETFGGQVGLLGQFDRNRRSDENQLQWRASVGLFKTQTKSLGDRSKTGLGYELGIQFGRPDGARAPSFALLWSVRPDAYTIDNHRLIGLISFPISTP